MSPAKNIKEKIPKKSGRTENKQAVAGESRIRELAYRLYEMRGRSNGNDRGDWFEAEKRIRSGENLHSC